MVTVSTSARTKGTWGVATNADINTTSTSYVDATGYTMSVDNNHYYTAMLISRSDAAQLRSMKFVEGATDKSEQTAMAANNTNFGYAWLTRQQNTQGSTQTTKVQYKNDSAGTARIYASSLMIKSSNNAWYVGWQNFSYGRFTLPMKISLVDLEFVSFPAGGTPVAEGANYSFQADASQGGDYGSISFAGAFYNFYHSFESHPDAFASITINNVVSALTFYGRSYQWTIMSLINPAGETIQNHSGPLWMVYDYGGTQVTFT